MCGRFTLTEPRGLAEAFDLDEPLPPLSPRFNVAPAQTVAVVAYKRNAGTQRGLALLRWGLVPSWSNDPSKAPKPINARSDSLDKPTFREAFRTKRCLIPADGFYEWSTVGTQKWATHFRLKDRSLFAFAGLWEFWTNGCEKLATCCIVTTDANALVGTVHNRMPVLLPKSAYDAWLSTETPGSELLRLLQPYPAEEMEGVAVGQGVNSVKNEGPELLERPG